MKSERGCWSLIFGNLLSNRELIVFLVLFLALIRGIVPVSAETLALKDAYLKAVARSEQLEQFSQEIKAAQVRYQQALADLYPELSLSAVQRVRSSSDFGSLSSGSFDDPSTGMRRSRTLGTSQFEGLLALSQPIFRGFQEFILAEVRAAQGAALKLQRQRAAELIFGDTAELYFQILSLQGRLRVIAEIEGTLRKRVRELEEFLALGKARESEVLSARADIAAEGLLRARSEKILAATREVFASLVGVEAHAFVLAPQSPVEPPEPLEVLLNRIPTRADVRANLEEQKSIEQQIEYEWRSLWPVISLDAVAYPYEDPERNRDWEVGVRVGVPLFEGGRAELRVSEQQALLAKSRWRHAELLRLAATELREAYANLQGAIRELDSARELRDMRRKNYHTQREDYALGVVTNLEVLDALEEWQAAELELVNAKQTAALERLRVDIAVGGFAP